MHRQLLFLHGAGKANKNRYDFLFNELEKKEIETFSFNFSGHSGIDIESSSLQKRYSEAVEKINKLNLNKPLDIMASSMGAYIAINLLEKFEVQNLILFCPALYTIDAFETPFGPEFTKQIRREGSWKNSDAFQILKKFRGNVLIIIGGQDEVIPIELIQMIDKSLVDTKTKEILTLENASHALADHIKVRPDLLKQTAEKINSLLI